MRSHGRVRRGIEQLLATVIVAAVGLVLGPISGASAGNLDGFDAGYLISDQNFYDSGSMDAAAIQSFLDARGSACVNHGVPCLKEFRQSTVSDVPKAVDDRCRGYAQSPNESAAEIIAKVSQSCGISPRVLLVVLQKEQSLITRTTATDAAYRSAMGYGCPDTAACDTQYYGFFNQVFNAARQFKNYAASPTKFNYRAGLVNSIRYHPNVACGASDVFIRNQATASLYNYTPYQPNKAALDAGTDPGDACSAYGNRNFFWYYSAWFGGPNGSRPIGSVDSATSTNTSITVQGWALDPDTSASTQAHLYLDGAGVAAVFADTSRPDLTALGKGDRHGYTLSTPASPGAHTVCTFAIASDAGPPTLLDCRVVVVPDAVPIGNVEAVTTTRTSITATGWTLDPDTSASIAAHVYIDGVGVALTADLPRADVAAAYGRGDRHGFTYTVTATPGSHTVCVFGINTVAAPNSLLNCRNAFVDTSTARPFGVVDAVTPSSTGVTVSGWTVDPDTNDPTQVHVYIDGTGFAITADQSRPDIAAIFGHGDRHGFSSTSRLTPGPHRVCTFAINTGLGEHTLLNCTNFTVRDTSPIGIVDSVVALPGSVMVSGWTLDPDTNDPIEAHVYIDGAGVALMADQSRPDIAAAYGKGDRHGFASSRAMASGSHQVCVFGINSSSGPNTLLSCRSVTVP